MAFGHDPITEAYEKIIRLLNEHHVKALNSPYVQKPLAWALYQTWKYVDEHEKPRGNDHHRWNSYCNCEPVSNKSTNTSEWTPIRDFMVKPQMTGDRQTLAESEGEE